MSKKPTPPPDDPEQSKRFEDTARELGAEDSGAAFDRLLDAVLPTPAPPADAEETPAPRGRSGGSR